MTTQSLLIDGQHRPSSDGSLMDVINPATEEVIATVPSATEADVDAAVAGARAALNGPWARLSARDRGRILWKLGDLLMARVDEIARLETLHNGKPIFESRHIEVPAAAECFQYYAGWADKVHGETIPVKGNYLAYTLREPVGVVAAIVPWNFPLLLTAWKVAPALACGNTVVLKPASQTPLTALALGDLALEAGVPPGVLNVITGPGSRVGRAIVRHPGVDKIAFTGDTATGREIMQGGAETLKRLTLELGGKSPNIVFPDADIEAAVRGASTGIFYGKGEVCAAGSRLLVDRSIRDEFLDKLVARTKKIVPGDPLDPKTRLGAIASKGQLERVLRYVDIARNEGATLLRRRSARRHRNREGLLHGADRVRGRHTGDDDCPGGNLRARARGDRVRRRRRSDRARERFHLRAGRRRVDARHQEGPLRRAPPASWHGMGEHLQRL